MQFALMTMIDVADGRNQENASQIQATCISLAKRAATSVLKVKVVPSQY